MENYLNKIEKDGYLLLTEEFDINPKNIQVPKSLAWKNPPKNIADSITENFMRLNTKLISYPEYGQGCPYHYVGINGKAGLSLSLSSRKLMPHTDLPHLSLPYEKERKYQQRVHQFTLLACIDSGKSKTETSIIKLDEILNRIPHEYIEYLKKPKFMVKTPSAWSTQKEYENVACLTSYKNQFHARISPNLISSKNIDYKEIFKKIHNIFDEHSTKIYLNTGDILVFKNTQVIHGRGNPSLDRVLIRAYGK